MHTFSQPLDKTRGKLLAWPERSRGSHRETKGVPTTTPPNMNLINSISLITSFAGGVVALFAPCCITFLLPSYLANIFREKSRVVWATLVFGLGIATVLVQTALGIRAIGQIFQQYHTI